MAHRIATLALGPLLFLQGLHVRRTTPRLPEPAGLRRGEAGQGAPLRLLVTGDSAAAGVGATVQAEALAGRLVEALAAHYRVRWELVATTGHTTADTLRVLQALPAERFDIAVTSLGVNDVTALHGTRRWLREQAALADLLRSKFGVRRVLLSALPPVHRFPALPQPLRWYLGARARLDPVRLLRRGQSLPHGERALSSGDHRADHHRARPQPAPRTRPVLRTLR